MEAIDPYSQSPVEYPPAAALVIGRSLCRFQYHLSQAVLLFPFGNTTAYRSEMSACFTSHCGSASCAIEAVVARTGSLKAGPCDDIYEAAQRCIDYLDSLTFHEQCDETLTLAAASLDQRDDDVNGLRQDIVDDLVVPWRERIAAAISSACGSVLDPYFQLGRQVDEGLCRPDIFQFLDVSRTVWPVICNVWPVYPRIEEGFDWTSLPVSGKRNLQPDCELSPLASTDRSPGDLAPQSLWAATVRARLADAGVDGKCRKIISDIEAACHKQTLRSEVATKRFDELWLQVYYEVKRRSACTSHPTSDVQKSRHGKVVKANVPAVDRETTLTAGGLLRSQPHDERGLTTAIDLLTEKLLTLADAAKLLPARRRGKQPCPSTLTRWAKIGFHGTKLEVTRVGDTTCTSVQALQRFFDRLTADSIAIGASSLDPKPVARHEERIEQELTELGI